MRTETEKAIKTFTCSAVLAFLAKSKRIRKKKAEKYDISYSSSKMIKKLGTMKVLQAGVK